MYTTLIFMSAVHTEYSNPSPATKSYIKLSLYEIIKFILVFNNQQWVDGREQIQNPK